MVVKQDSFMYRGETIKPRIFSFKQNNNTLYVKLDDIIYCLHSIEEAYSFMEKHMLYNTECEVEDKNDNFNITDCINIDIVDYDINQLNKAAVKLARETFLNTIFKELEHVHMVYKVSETASMFCTEELWYIFDDKIILFGISDDDGEQVISVINSLSSFYNLCENNNISNDIVIKKIYDSSKDSLAKLFLVTDNFVIENTHGDFDYENEISKEDISEFNQELLKIAQNIFK